MTTIERATAADAGELAAVAARTFALACPPSTTEEAIRDFIDRHLSAERMAGYLADETRDLFIARDGTAAVGYVMTVAGEPADPDVSSVVTTRPTVELSKCYLLEASHGTGTAAAMVDAAIGAALARGARSVWLGVNQQNQRANRFYEKCGFRLVGERRFLVGQSYESDFVRERTQ
ncbi:GNAT family N-acetyltransferase [Marisediminicola senii]|uniref:GNAT family N-acetyltransferase n=1 Tax=Marisediminicola senii TaxID=2711233 RepID=UPI0013EA40E5|nr:GNAT family N-acetyltransferase [Marisediminicola senii]